jgi:hypothetical protein
LSWHTTRPARGRRRGSKLLRPVAAGFASLSLALVWSQPASAQARDRPDISVAPAIEVRPAAQVPFPIWVRLEQVPRNSFIRVQGLPRGAALSEGYAIAPGAWAVPLNALSGLKITLPENVAGKADVVVTLVGLDGAVLSKAIATLVIAAPSTPADDTRKRALQFLRRGNERLVEGQVAPARGLYERAADMGLAEAAMALAATYDAAELTLPHLRGIAPDAKEARRWYERARELGAPDAERRLQRLETK